MTSDTSACVKIRILIPIQCGYGLKIKIEVSVVACNFPKFVFFMGSAVSRVFFARRGCGLWFP